MADREHLAQLGQGIESWNKWRKSNPDVRPDLNGVNLRDAILNLADLNGADLSCADLNGVALGRANLNGTLLSASDLTGAQLCDASLMGANARGAYLVGADLRGAYLIDADFCFADLRDANLSEAKLLGTIFADTNLSGVIGLETCKHAGPSPVGIDTLFKSGGKIPAAFLRGCGVPEQFIVYAQSLAGQIEYYSCFISYSNDDQEFAGRVHADLLAKNLRCWFAPEDLKIGDRFQERIEESIRVFDKVMIVLSEASVRSRWVEREVNAAREREERENRTVLFPIRIDDTVMNAPQSWAAHIRRSRHIGDFRQWRQHDRYEQAFERLLRDLKAKDTTPEP